MKTHLSDAKEEVKKMIDSGVFFPAYTHVSSNLARSGVEKTKRLMSISVAVGNDIVPFSGEAPSYPMWTSYLLRAFYVSVAGYPSSDEHSWKMYLRTMLKWTPELSAAMINEFEQKLGSIDRQRRGLDDILNPKRRDDMKAKITACIEFERLRQDTYVKLTESEREEIKSPRQEIYLFGSNLGKIATQTPFGGRSKIDHPVVPGDLNLCKYLIGMATSLDVDETREWISACTGKDIPVVTLDALASWQDSIVPKLPSFRECPNTYNFHHRVLADSNFRQRIITEVANL